MYMKIPTPLKLILSIIMCQVAGLIGSLFTFQSIPTWYQTLEKPFFNPPNVVFGPVWTILYTLMGISFFILWTAKKKMSIKKKAYYFFFAQLLLNTIWSIIFFGMKNPGLALIDITILLLMIILTILSMWKISRNASLLLIPYLLWVSFASLLNAAIFILN